MADGFVGKWQSVGFDNIEALWDSLGVPDAIRQHVKDNKTELSIAKDGNGYKLTTVAGDRKREVVFLLGQEIDTIDMMGKPVKAVLTVEDGAMVERQKSESGEIVIQRQLINGNLKTNMSANGVTATISFARA